MTYTELRTTIAANITDQDVLVSLLTAENVQTVELCAPGVGVATDYVQGDTSSAYYAGVLVAEGLYDPKSSPRTVDQVLAWFAPANIYAAQMYARLQDARLRIGSDLDTFLATVDAEANEIAPLPC